jgi:hypothetical protein
MARWTLYGNDGSMIQAVNADGVSFDPHGNLLFVEGKRDTPITESEIVAILSLHSGTLAKKEND